MTEQCPNCGGTTTTYGGLVTGIYTHKKDKGGTVIQDWFGETLATDAEIEKTETIGEGSSFHHDFGYEWVWCGTCKRTVADGYCDVAGVWHVREFGIKGEVVK